jgi:hypothetical protein
MSGDTVSIAEASNSSDEGSRQRSKIGFPYVSLKDATALVEAIHGNVGANECDDAQLAAWTGQSTKSSGFRVQVSSARMYGLITTEGTKHKITDLGQMIIDPTRMREAKAVAFLNVPLNKAIFEKYKTGILPPNAAALEREMVSLGVSSKVTDRARVSFEKSAEQAGFFEHGKNRLVMPGFIQARDPVREEPKDETGGGGGGGDGGSGADGLNLDPLLIALLKKIPSAEKGWNAAQRVRWFRTFAMNVSQIYDTDDQPVEMKIDLDELGSR